MTGCWFDWAGELGSVFAEGFQECADTLSPDGPFDAGAWDRLADRYSEYRLAHVWQTHLAAGGADREARTVAFALADVSRRALRHAQADAVCAAGLPHDSNTCPGCVKASA